MQFERKVHRKSNAISKEYNPKDSKQVTRNQLEPLTSQPGDWEGIFRSYTGAQNVLSMVRIFISDYQEPGPPWLRVQLRKSRL